MSTSDGNLMENTTFDRLVAVDAPEAGIVPARRPRGYTLRRLLATADVASITVAVAIGTEADLTMSTRRGTLWSLALLPMWVLLFKIYGLYDRDGKRVSHSTIDEAPALFNALVVGSLALWAFARFGPMPHMILRAGVVFFFAAFALVLISRVIARSVARALIPPERTLLIGGGAMTRLLVHKIRQHPEYRLNPIGWVSASGLTDPDDQGVDVKFLGSVDDIRDICARLSPDRMIVASAAVGEAELEDVIRIASASDVKVSVLPHFTEVLGPSVEIDDVEGITVLGINPPVLTPSSRLLKRSMDVGLSVVALVVFSPVMLAAAIAVKATSRGPVLFRQLRVGRGGRRFTMYKFRTMVRDAEARAAALSAESLHPSWLVLERDPRVTRVGRVLRRASIDELPQLWNVLVGDMSLVGPRPMPLDLDTRILGWHRRRLDLTPGITGLWQVLGRANIPFDEMLKLDYLYVMNWSLWQDARLLIHTLPAIVKRRGAN
ncbi:MAG: hypothetical protein QOH95_185 [Gaiellaceae bacterium]|nr:hypothetical protein [Gaiellaceae bacterium]